MHPRPPGVINLTSPDCTPSPASKIISPPSQVSRSSPPPERTIPAPSASGSPRAGPTERAMDPPALLLEVPLEMAKRPELPCEAVPVCKVTEPLVPMAPALAVSKLAAPDGPDRTYTGAPRRWSAWPPRILRRPPSPPSARAGPPRTSMSPPSNAVSMASPPVQAPPFTMTEPAFAGPKPPVTRTSGPS